MTQRCWDDPCCKEYPLTCPKVQLSDMLDVIALGSRVGYCEVG